jgi:acyl-CoA synthetase (NDP forming)
MQKGLSLVFPVVDPKQENDLSVLLPDIATVSNPLDYTTPIWGQAEMTYPVFAKAILGDRSRYCGLSTRLPSRRARQL